MKSDDLLPLMSERVNYNAETGDLTWKWHESMPYPWNRRWAGKVAGCVNAIGYRAIMIKTGAKSRLVLAHRLAFYIVHGCAPVGDIDHINGDRTDNKASNLREVSRSLNNRNARLHRHNTSGICGVYWDDGRAKWCAQAKINGKNHHLGRFDTAEDAANAARTFRSRNEFTDRHGVAA